MPVYVRSQILIDDVACKPHLIGIAVKQVLLAGYSVKLI
jgi:hypothetical protein